MKFLPNLTEQGSYVLKPQFSWEAGVDAGGRLFQLFQENELIASLYLPMERTNPAFMQLGNDIFEFRDSSSFFIACLCLVKKEGGQLAGSIEKSTRKTAEGTIVLQNHRYSWKFSNSQDATFSLMDQQRIKLFSYHYKHDFVRLMLKAHGRQDPYLIPLLCIGLYLLPLWHSNSLSKQPV